MNRIIKIQLLIILMLSVTSLYSDTSVTDTVTLSYSDSGAVIILGMTGIDKVSLSIWAGLQVALPGSPVIPGGTGAAQTAGGRLWYTLYDMPGSYVITVETPEQNYNDDAVSVKILEIYDGGSGINTLGTASEEFIPIKTDLSMNLITGISGSNTWTGQDRYDGARVLYRLSSDPGGISGSRLTVLYTIKAEN